MTKCSLGDLRYLDPIRFQFTRAPHDGSNIFADVGARAQPPRSTQDKDSFPF